MYMTVYVSLAHKIVKTLTGYATSQLILMSIVTGISWITLSLLHVRYAGLLACITGALSVIPVLGMLTAASIAGLVAIFDGSRFLNGPAVTEGVVLLLGYVALNFLIDWFLSPYLIGKASNIHPVLLFLAVLAGSAVFGILGAALAVPSVLVIKTIVEHYNTAI